VNTEASRTGTMVEETAEAAKPKFAEPKNEIDNDQTTDSKSLMLFHSCLLCIPRSQTSHLIVFDSTLGVFSLTVNLPHEPYKIQIMVAQTL
jgi:hypothetical protein